MCWNTALIEEASKKYPSAENISKFTQWYVEAMTDLEALGLDADVCQLIDELISFNRAVYAACKNSCGKYNNENICSMMELYNKVGAELIEKGISVTLFPTSVFGTVSGI